MSSDKAATVFAALLVSAVVLAGLTCLAADHYGTRYHLVVTHKYTLPPVYQMESCFFFDHECSVYGYEWNLTPEGKAEAEKQIKWFREYKKQTTERIAE